MGPPPLFRLAGLLFVGVAALYVLKPREMLDWTYRTYADGARVEATTAKLLASRALGVVMLLVGVGVVLDAFPG